MAVNAGAAICVTQDIVRVVGNKTGRCRKEYALLLLMVSKSLVGMWDFYFLIVKPPMISNAEFKLVGME